MTIEEIESFLLKRLAKCHRTSGLVVGEIAYAIAKQPGRESPRRHSAFVASIFAGMEKRGLVVRADDQKPILWRKAP